MTAPLLIGLIGNAGADKDTVAAYLEHEHAFETLGFADPILDMACALFHSVDVDTAYAIERHLKERPVDVLNLSYRQIAQSLGTGWGRELVAPDLWIRIADHTLKQRRLHGDDVAISDVRFKNEAEWIRHSGGVLVRVHRSGLQPVASHVSETELAGIQADHELLNDGSLSTLFDQVDRLLDTLRPSGAPSHL